MDDPERFRLLHGPYAAPPVKRGDKIHCEHRGREVVVGRTTDARIQWPMTGGGGQGATGPILCGDLIRAVRVESVIAVAYWWGVHVHTASRWRKSLGVPALTEGTHRLYLGYSPEKFTEEVRAAGRAAAKAPEARERLAARLRGRPLSPASLEARRKARTGRPVSPGVRRKLDEECEARWTPELNALLGTVPDRVVSELTGKPVSTVQLRRTKLGIPALGRWPKP